MNQKDRKVKVVLCTVTAVLAFSNFNIAAHAAADVTSVLPSAGVDYTLAPDGTSLKNIQEGVDAGQQVAAMNGEVDSSTAAGVLNHVVNAGGLGGTENGAEGETQAELQARIEPAEDLVIAETKTVDVSLLDEKILKDVQKKLDRKDEEEGFKSLVIAKVNDYVNVRDMPSEEGEIIGKLYDKSVGTFLSEENGWYKIKSGSVTGYVKGEYCVTGDDAVELAKAVGTRIATVTTTTLKVRQEPGLDKTVLGMVPIEDQLIVTEELDGWVRVNIEEGDGYVSTDYVSLTTEFVQAESREEEKARLAKEEAERKAAQAAARKKAGRSSSSGGSSGQVMYASGGGSEMGRAVANYALQFVGNPYVYGGTSLTNGADCSGFVMSVYANFGVSLPHSSSADRSVGAAVNGLANAQPGDLVCYSGHVGLYIGNGQIVHASTSRTGIIVSNANYRTPLSVRRIF